MGKRLLTFDDLCDYYANHKNMVVYSADKNHGTPVVVQLEGTMTFSDNDYDPELSLLKTHLKSCHIGTNRNHSNIAQSVMEEATSSIYNRPILGFIHKLSDDTYDFAGHEMFINDEGEVEYEEIPVGCIPESGNAHLVYDEENDKTYLEVDGVIFEEYTRAAQILKSKKESKVSVELALLDYSYDPKNKELIINRFYFSGITILGRDRDTEKPIEEGMYGSKITLKDFKQNNSMFSNETEEMKKKLIEMQESIKTMLSSFNINNSQELNENYGKEEENVEDQILVNEEITEESTVESTEETKVDEEVTETESIEEVTETETENESEETVDESTPEVVKTEVEGCKKKKKCEENSEDEKLEEDEESEEDESLDTNGCKKKKKCDEKIFETIEKTFEIDGKKFSVSFELSHEDIRCGLYNLICEYEEIDNDWYDIRAVYDDSFVFQGFFSGKIYGQKYIKDGNVVTLDGERYNLHEELLTDSEYTELMSMRANYAELKQYKEDMENAQLHSQREEILNNEKYSVLAEKDENNEYKNEAYAKLVSEMDNYSLVDLEKELKSVFADYITNGGQFAYNNEVEMKPSVSKKLFAKSTEKKPSRYGNLFNK